MFAEGGGYCFELNGLFYYLLKAIGFNVYSVAVFIREDLDYLNDLGHRANICIIDGRAYFTEVGYGGSSSPDYAIPLDGETTGEYFIREEKKEYTLYRIVDKDKEIAKGNEQFLTNIPVSYPAKFGYEPVVKAVTSKPIEMFRDYVAYPVEFYLPNIAISLNPDSKFVKNLVVNFRNDKGEVYSIYNDQFTSRTINGTETHQIQNLTELKSILSEHFDIKL